MTPTPRLPVARIVSPRSVAVVGASEDVGKFGGRVLHYLVRHGFQGRILPINPKRATLRGLPAYGAVGDAPGPVDVAIVAVPASQLLAQVVACAAAGVGACVVITGKLADAGEEGAALERRVVAAARGAGMRLVGPNCLGIFNFTDRAMLSSSLALEAPSLRAGPVGMVSQSGALMGTLASRGIDHGVGFSRCVSVGNQADLELNDFLEFLVEDDATGVVALYIEGLKDAARFALLARRARAAGKPVLAVKAGRSEEGAQAARSHTASLAGSYAAFQALCRDCGVVVMDDPDTMVLAADALVRLPRLPAAGLGVAVMSGSGGSTAVAADQLPAAGLRMGSLSSAAQDVLGQWLPPTHVHLPVDTGAFLGGSSAEGIVAVGQALLADPGIGALLCPATTQPRMAETAALYPPLARAAGKPVLYVATMGSVGDPSRQRLREEGFPCFDRVSDALGVLRALEAEAALRHLPPSPARPGGAGPELPPLPGPGFLTEPEAKRLAAAYGIPVARERRAATAEDAVTAAEALGYPVALKGISRKVVHKSGLGLVRLHLRDAAAVRTAFAEVQAALDQAAPGSGEGCLVCGMVLGQAELILGARHDPQYGPLLLLGIGGVLVEALRDVQVAVAPVSAATAEAMLRRLALWPVLAGAVAHGQGPADVAAAVDAAVRLSWLAADAGPRLAEMDLNPLILRAAGQGAVAVDARATVAA